MGLENNPAIVAWPPAQAFDLPAVEYTARDVLIGLLFWAFAQRRSAAASAVFAARIHQHLERCGVSLLQPILVCGHNRRVDLVWL